MRTRLLLVLITLLAAPLAAQSAPPTAGMPPPDMSRLPWSPVRRNATPGGSAATPTFRANVNLVNVLVSVADRDGAPYGKLQKEDFRVYEDGTEQKVALFERESALPLSILMELDTSLSTRKDLPQEIAAARRFAHDILRPADVVSLYEFSTYVSQMLPFTSDERRLDEALSRPHTGPATALYDAIYLGSRALARRQGRKVIVLISDGGDTASKADYPQALRAAESSEAMIYAIIMVPIEADAGRDLGGEHALIQLSEDTGGKYYYADSPSQLDDAFRQIGDELRTQYLLGYYPSSAAGPEFRRIDVELTAGARQRAGRELIVRHRAGYYVSKTQ